MVPGNCQPDARPLHLVWNGKRVANGEGKFYSQWTNASLTIMLLTTVNVRRTMSSLVPLDTFETVFARMKNRANEFMAAHTEELMNFTSVHIQVSTGQMDKLTVHLMNDELSINTSSNR